MIKVSEMKIKSKVDWNSINWRKIQLRIWRIQKKFTTVQDEVKNLMLSNYRKS